MINISLELENCINSAIGLNANGADTEEENMTGAMGFANGGMVPLGISAKMPLLLVFT